MKAFHDEARDSSRESQRLRDIRTPRLRSATGSVRKRSKLDDFLELAKQSKRCVEIVRDW
jgi:hypothetical protein